EPAIAVQRDSDRDGWIVSLELHSAGDQQIIKFINVHRASGLTKQKRAGLGDRSIRKPVTDRFEIGGTRWNASIRVQICNGTRILVAAAILRSVIVVPIREALKFILKPHRGAAHRVGRFARCTPVSGPHSYKQAVDGG